MKKSYAKPLIEIETYELSASIAANCFNVINLGPGISGTKYEMCSDYNDSGFGLMNIIPQYGLNSTEKVTPFYADGAKNCDCYYTSGNRGYFTS